MRGRQSWFAIAAFTVLVAGVGGAAGQGRGAPGDVALFSARNGNNDIYIMSWTAGNRSKSPPIPAPMSTRRFRRTDGTSPLPRIEPATTTSTSSAQQAATP
jgi:hypothetical protein